MKKPNMALKRDSQNAAPLDSTLGHTRRTQWHPPSFLIHAKGYADN